jgi:hypothetical protein
MAIKTVQFYGLAYGLSPAVISVTANGTQVFTGTVPTSNGPVPALPNDALIPDQVVLFTYEIDSEFTGEIPMTCTVAAGVVIFGQIYSNYVVINNPIYSPEQIAIINDPESSLTEKVAVYSAEANPPFSAEEIAILENPETSQAVTNEILAQHNCSVTINSGSDIYGPIDVEDPRNTVFIDGVQKFPDHVDYPGTWWWCINASSVFAYNLEVDPQVVGIASP